MSTSHLSFLSSAEKLTLLAYEVPRGYSIILSEVISRLAAVILLSLGAALDIAMHSALIFPACLYALGKSLYNCEIDFSLPWQHLQRVRNAVFPLLFGSAFGLIHPYAGIAVCEPSDKHSILGMLSSNTGKHFDTPCSPVHSLSIIEDIAATHQYAEKDGVKKEIFSPEHLQIIQDAKSFEKSLELLQAQEYIYKITNITLFVMAIINKGIKDSYLGELNQQIAIRLTGFLIPIFSVVDTAIALIMQTFFLATGIVQIISGRGPIYTEVTFNPEMHITFLMQNILKLVGNLIGTLGWLIIPEYGFRVSLLPATLFFKAQMSLLMLEIQIKMYFAKDNTRFALPIVFGNGEHSPLSFPFHSMHKTYLIVEKEKGTFNLYWVNRPEIRRKSELDSQATLEQIRLMLDARFPFMDIEKVAHYPVKSEKPEFPKNSIVLCNIMGQGNNTNCVVSNLFGMLHALDIIRHDAGEITQLRYKVARESLIKNYGFYEGDFSPFSNLENDYALEEAWDRIGITQRDHPSTAI